MIVCSFLGFLYTLLRLFLLPNRFQNAKVYKNFHSRKKRLLKLYNIYISVLNKNFRTKRKMEKNRKNEKRLLSLVLAVVMVLSMSMSVFAADGRTAGNINVKIQISGETYCDETISIAEIEDGAHPVELEWKHLQDYGK